MRERGRREGSVSGTVCVVILGKGVKALSESVFTVDSMLTYVCLCVLEWVRKRKREREGGRGREFGREREIKKDYSINHTFNSSHCSVVGTWTDSLLTLHCTGWNLAKAYMNSDCS